jgi:hypothetical protein
MRLDKFYSTMAAQVVESLREEHLDLDRFVPALYQEMRSAVKTINDSADDYEPDELSWAADQDREAKLHMEGLSDAIAELEVVDRYSLPSDDQINLHHVKAAKATLQNLKRRMEA